MNDIIVGVQEIERVREFVAVLMNDVCHTAAIDFGFVSSRTLWIKFRFSMVKVCVVVGYDLTERGTWQLGQQGGSEVVMRCPCVSWV